LQLSINEPTHQQQTAEESKNLHHRSSKTHEKAVLGAKIGIYARTCSTGKGFVRYHHPNTSQIST